MNSAYQAGANSTGYRPLVLLVEDNPNDAELAHIAIAELPFRVELIHVADGEACLDYLHAKGAHTDARRPDLVLLDLRMPRMSGLEVLRAIADDAELKTIPFVVLTTSTAPSDIENAYAAGAKSYISKPIGYSRFAKMLADVCTYWLGVVTPVPRQRIGPATDVQV